MKRILSVILAVLMISGMAASAVSAADFPFTDVKTTRWSYSSVKYAYDKGYMNGTSTDKFTPAGTMTRAMVVTVLYRREGSPDVAFSDVFSDVKDGTWYSEAVIWAKNSGVVNGTSATTFTPEGKITREQLATMLNRYTGYIGLDNEAEGYLGAFVDSSKVSEYAKDAMAWATYKGIITGIEENFVIYLQPKGNATREQFATILERFDNTDLSLPLEYNTPALFTSYTEPVYDKADDADIFVSPDGDDENGDGSFADPYASFAKAVDAVKELKKTKTEGGITVAFMEGTYAAPLNVRIDAESSGTGECPVVYRPYDDGEVIFTAGITLPLEGFEKIDESEKYMFQESVADDVMKLDLSEYGVDVSALNENNNLFCGTNRMDIARWPNKNSNGSDAFVDYISAVSEDQMSMTLLPNLTRRINKYHDLEDLCVLGYFKYDWSAAYGKVISYDPETGVLYPPVGPSGIKAKTGDPNDYSPCPYWYFYNITEELDRTDEYFIDEDTAILYVLSPTEDFTLSSTGNMFSFSGAEYVTLKGMTFCYSTGSFAVANGEHLEFNDLTIRNMRNYGFTIDGDNNTIYGCTFYDVGRRCIDLHCGDRETLTKGNCVIENNLFERFGTVGKTGMAAVYVTGCGIDIRHNEFRQSSNIAVFYSESIWPSNFVTVEYNYIDKTVLQSSDSGAIYAGRNVAGHGSVVRYNIVANTGNFKEGHKSLGIYLDDGMSGQQIYGNIFYNSANHAIFNNGGRENSIHDNIIISVDGNERIEISLGGSFGYDPERFDILEQVNFRNEFWSKIFPSVAAYEYDRNDIEAYVDNIMYPTYPAFNECYGNTIITAQNRIDAGNLEVYSDDTVRFAIKGEGIVPSVTYNLETNPFFTDPTHGDYTFTEDYTGMDIPVKEIG